MNAFLKEGAFPPSRLNSRRLLDPETQQRVILISSHRSDLSKQLRRPQLKRASTARTRSSSEQRETRRCTKKSNENYILWRSLVVAFRNDPSLDVVECMLSVAWVTRGYRI